MLHGNLLLRGWWTADVSFYTTELPEYVLVVLVRGLRPDVVHICGRFDAAATVLLAALLARGRAKGLAGVVGALVAVGVMLAPSMPAGHRCSWRIPTTSARPCAILLILLVLDRAQERWYVPVVVCGLLAWAKVADELAVIAVAVPVGAVAVVLLVVLAIRLRPLREFWYGHRAGGGRHGLNPAGGRYTEGDPRARRLRPAPASTAAARHQVAAAGSHPGAGGDAAAALRRQRPGEPRPGLPRAVPPDRPGARRARAAGRHRLVRHPRGPGDAGRCRRGGSHDGRSDFHHRAVVGRPGTRGRRAAAVRRGAGRPGAARAAAG